MTLENKIRRLAARKTVVRITKRKRNATGFKVTGHGRTDYARTKNEALECLRARLRCSAPAEWTVEPNGCGAL